MNYKIISEGPDLISVEEVKTYLRVDGIEEDQVVSNLIDAAIDFCENKTKRALKSRTYDYFIDSLKQEVVLPKPPLSLFTSITLKSKSGQETILESDKYYVDTNGEPCKVFIYEIPSYDPVPSSSVVMRFNAGYTSVTLPKTIYQAILLLVSHWYENRNPVGSTDKQLEFTIDALLNQHKIYAW